MQKDTSDLPLFSYAVFHGAGYDKQKDHARLSGNLKKVHDVMVDFKPHTLRELSKATDVPEASVSACLRTLRNQYGYVIDKQRAGDASGTWLYWIAAGGMGVHSRKARKMKPIGDHELFGEMMRTIYAHAKIDAATPPVFEDNGDIERFSESQENMRMAAQAWQDDMVERIKKAGGQ